MESAIKKFDFEKKCGFKKPIAFWVFSLFVAVSVFTATDVKANGNIYGWAWSSNIGWISFNNQGINDAEGNEVKPGGGSVDYGANIGSDGVFTGYAWSENVGWITFNSGSLTGCPSGTCNAKVDLDTFAVTGWARACSVFQSGCSGNLNENRGGWDGWIQLYNLWIDTSVSPAEFRYWVWGGNPDNDFNKSTIGWGAFNCIDDSNVCGQSNYKVVTTMDFDDIFEPPQVLPPSGSTSSPVQNYCSSGAGTGLINFGWIYYSPTAKDEREYIFQVSESSNFGSSVIYKTVDAKFASNTGNSQSAFVKVLASLNDLEYDTTYYWRVQVYDENGLNSDWYTGPSFKTAAHPYPSPSFISDPLTTIVNRAVSFNNTSSCYGAGETVCTYLWNFGDNSTSSEQNTTHAYQAVATYYPSLTVTNDLGSCSVSGSVVVKSALGTPTWKEISPF